MYVISLNVKYIEMWCSHGGFPKWGYHQSSSIIGGIFPNKNHPILGVPPIDGKPHMKNTLLCEAAATESTPSPGATDGMPTAWWEVHPKIRRKPWRILSQLFQLFQGWETSGTILIFVYMSAFFVSNPPEFAGVWGWLSLFEPAEVRRSKGWA